MKTSLANDRLIFQYFTAGEGLKKLRSGCDHLLGDPIWWVAFRATAAPKNLKPFFDQSHQIWADPRLRHYPHAHHLLAQIRARSKDAKPHVFTLPKNTTHYAVPLVAGGRVIGHCGLIGMRKDTRHELLSLVAGHIAALVDAAARKEEVERLSETIRPRAIALSTVHTVHRIINSTLNLDELISRLAHLTAQVLRANRTAIYLIDSKQTLRSTGAPKALVCRARVGYPKHQSVRSQVPIGHGIEGRVAKTANVVLRQQLICIPLIDEDIIGVITVSNKKDRKNFTYFDQEILTTLAEEAVIAIKNALLYEEQKKVTLSTIQSLAEILGSRTENPTNPEAFLRVAVKLAEELKLSEEDSQALHYATLLKDTAKIGIPEEILKKPTKLTGDEYRILREHPIKGAQIVQSFESLKPVVPIILHSREKFDGTGYPKGLKGEEIPIGARILAVLNAFEAIIIGRPYRNRYTFREALLEIQKNKGSQFDPRVVDAFVRVMEKENFMEFLKKDAHQVKASR